MAYLLLARAARPFRPLGWAFLAVFGVMLTTNTKSYYLVPAFVAPFAAGGVALERLKAGVLGPIVRAATIGLVVAGGIVAAPMAKAILPEDSYVRYAEALGAAPPQEERHSLGRLPQLFADMHGWPELAGTVAGVYRKLPAEDRARACIFAQNYGQAGAIDLFGPRLGLPKAISGHNNYFLWGPRGCTGEIVIVIGDRREDLAPQCGSVELAATHTCADCMPYENNLPIWVARGLKVPVSVAWAGVKNYI